LAGAVRLPSETVRENGSKEETESAESKVGPMLGVTGVAGVTGVPVPDSMEMKPDTSPDVDFLLVLLLRLWVPPPPFVLSAFFRTTIRTAWPLANNPKTETTPTANNLPPESLRDRTRCAPASIMTLPAGARVKAVQDLASRMGVSDALNRVCGGRTIAGVVPPLGSSIREESARRTIVSVEVIGAEANADDGVEMCDDVTEVDDKSRESYSMILKIFSGCFEEVTIVSTPAAVAISAAMSFVSIPPVPSLEPNVAVLTGWMVRAMASVWRRPANFPDFRHGIYHFDGFGVRILSWIRGV